MKSNILYLLTSLDMIDTLKENGINKFIYPLSFFCVGIPKTYDLSEIKEDNSYLYINRILNSKDANNLNEILHNLPSNIKGVIFDDIGISLMLKDVSVEKILYNTHFTTNYESINAYFDYVDDIVVSTDVSEEEYDEIISKSKKDVSFIIFGLIPGMYSRRTLVTSFNKNYDLEDDNILNISNNDKKFIAVQNEYGTYIYHYPYYDGRRLKLKKHHYDIYMPVLLDTDKQKELLNNNYDHTPTDYGFLDTKTIYKVRRD